MIQGFHLEFPIVPLQGPAVLKNHHRGHHVGASGVGNVVGLYAVGPGGKPRQSAQLLQGLAHPLRLGGNALRLLPGVALGHAQQLCPLASLGHPQPYPVTAVPAQQLLQGLRVLRQGRHADLLRCRAPARVILPQHGGEGLPLVLLGSGGEDLYLPAQEVSLLQMQHAEAPAHLAPVQAPYIRVGAHPGNDPLGLAQHAHRPNAVPQGGGPFKVQLLRRLGHLLLHLPGQGPVVAAENTRRLLRAPLILRLSRPLRAAEAVAFSDVQIQAGPLFSDVPGEFPAAGGELQRPAYRLNGQPGLPPPAKGPEVPGTVLLRPAHQTKPGVRRPLVQAHKGVALVVL